MEGGSDAKVREPRTAFEAGDIVLIVQYDTRLHFEMSWHALYRICVTINDLWTEYRYTGMSFKIYDSALGQTQVGMGVLRRRGNGDTVDDGAGSVAVAR